MLVNVTGSFEVVEDAESWEVLVVGRVFGCAVWTCVLDPDEEDILLDPRGIEFTPPAGRV